mgnify:CR=1 FL=1
MSLIDVQMSACNPIINYSFAEGSHYTHCNGAKLKKDMSKSTFKILFYLRKNQVNKDGTVCIMIRLSLNGEITQFSSKLSVKPDAWDTVLGKAKGNTHSSHFFSWMKKVLLYIIICILFVSNSLKIWIWEWLSIKNSLIFE